MKVKKYNPEGIAEAARCRPRANHLNNNLMNRKSGYHQDEKRPARTKIKSMVAKMIKEGVYQCNNVLISAF